MQKVRVLLWLVQWMKRFGKAFCPKCKVIYFVDRSSCCNKRILTIYKFIVLTFSHVQEVKEYCNSQWNNTVYKVRHVWGFLFQPISLSRSARSIWREQWVVEYMSMSDEELTRTFYAASLVQSAWKNGKLIIDIIGDCCEWVNRL